MNNVIVQAAKMILEDAKTDEIYDRIAEMPRSKTAQHLLDKQLAILRFALEWMEFGEWDKMNSFAWAAKKFSEARGIDLSHEIEVMRRKHDHRTAYPSTCYACGRETESNNHHCDPSFIKKRDAMMKRETCIHEPRNLMTRLSEGFKLLHAMEQP